MDRGELYSKWWGSPSALFAPILTFPFVSRGKGHRDSRDVESGTERDR